MNFMFSKQNWKSDFLQRHAQNLEKKTFDFNL